MSIFLDQVKLSVKCHRDRHESCRNQKKTCSCQCHRNEELQKILDETGGIV